MLKKIGLCQIIPLRYGQHTNDFLLFGRPFRAVTTGDTYVFPPDMRQADAQQYWMKPEHNVYVAEYDGDVVGTFYFKPII